MEIWGEWVLDWVEVTCWNVVSYGVVGYGWVWLGNFKLRDLTIFPTGTYMLLGCRYTGIV